MPLTRRLSAIITLVLGGSVGSLSAQIIDLGAAWHFHPGDDPTWSQPQFDDSQWPTINAGKPWEDQGYTDHDGFAWYRKQITIPSRLREQARYRLSGALWLSLDRIDDVDATWVNGRRVGGSGSFPPDYVSAWQVRRSYSVPGNLIRWDQANVIAVRVYDGQRTGGLIGKRLQIRAATLREVIRLKWDPRGGNGLFHDAGPVVVHGQLHNGSPKMLTGTLHWTVEDDAGTPLATHSKPLTLPARDTQAVQHTFQPAAPGFYKFHCVFRPRDNNIELKYSRVVGYQPQAIEAPLTRAPDFDDFWKQTLESLADVKPEFSMQRHSELDSTHHEVYEVSMRSLGQVRVRGWYEKPKTTGSVPALLRVPGYGQNMKPTGDPVPLAVFSFNVRGHGNSQDDVPGQPADFWVRGLD
ncbi:MAG: acetylxylan esterase, partial [Planctomycetaceae bacterium]